MTINSKIKRGFSKVWRYSPVGFRIPLLPLEGPSFLLGLVDGGG